jgi:radical SAM superfamily enzyme YgiQ (UPF0313 family)
MYEAGFDWIFIGIETPDEAALAECKKKQNMHRNLVEQVRYLQRCGLQVQAGFIIGFDSDKPDIFQRQFNFIQDSGIVMAMVGILQAPTGTELYKRMEREGRLLGGFSGNNVIDDTNIITKMDRHFLSANYRELVKSLYEPKNYYDRVRNFLSQYKEPKEKPPVDKNVVMAVLRCFFWLGMVRSGRSHFWRVLLWALRHKRESVQNFLGLAILGYHFRKIHEGLGKQPLPPQQPQPVQTAIGGLQVSQLLETAQASSRAAAKNPPSATQPREAAEVELRS